jgi:hypothetical protein
MNLLTSLRLRLVYWLTSWLEDPYQPAAFVEQDDDVHELTDEEWNELVKANPSLGMPADCGMAALDEQDDLALSLDPDQGEAIADRTTYGADRPLGIARYDIPWQRRGGGE